MPVTLIDTHCHLSCSELLSDLAGVLKRAEEAGVERILCAGYDLESSERAVDIARTIPAVVSAVGLHPHDAASFTPSVERRIAELAECQGVVAIGETGLDYHYEFCPRDIQQEAFRRHIHMAHRFGMPLIVHSRNAGTDVLRILSEEGFPSQGVIMHCLPADHEFAQRAVAYGCYLGVAGPITFRNAQRLREIVSQVPLDLLLIETDAPYLSPHPYRGKLNEPARLPLIAQALAEAVHIPFEELAATTTYNATTVLGI